MADDDPIRVEDKSTGHKVTILERSFDPEAFTRLKDPAVDQGGAWLPPEHNMNVGKTTKKGSDS